MTTYLLTLLAAAATNRGRGVPGPVEARLRFVVLIPAHNEGSVIAQSLGALNRLEYPRDHFEIIVVADNCEDDTAAVASACGATVYERTDVSRSGKGAALMWGLECLWEGSRQADAVAFVDADCLVSANFLTALQARLATGARAVQVAYGAANPEASSTAALRFASLALINTLRPLGKSRLGLSCGLFGSGMGFSRGLLEEHPWRAESLAEDVEYHLRLVLAGERVVFAREASVVSPMPTSQRNSREQRLRWETGKWQLVATWTPRLLLAGLRRRRVDALHAGLELLIPGQLVLLAVATVSAFGALALRSPRALKLATANLIGQTVYVLLGLVRVGAPVSVYRALAWAPLAMVDALGLHLRILTRRGPTSWVKTARPSDGPTTASSIVPDGKTQ